MAISGLVLTLTPHEEMRVRTMQILADLPGLDLGELDGVRLPVVLDSPDRRADRALFEQLQAMPGVLNAEVAYVWFDSEEGGAGPNAAPHLASDAAALTDATTLQAVDLSAHATT